MRLPQSGTSGIIAASALDLDPPGKFLPMRTNSLIAGAFGALLAWAALARVLAFDQHPTIPGAREPAE